MANAITIRDTGSLAQKFVKRGQAAVDDWKTGVQQTTASQSANAIAAAPRWQQALQGDAVLNRFKAKLTAAGDGKWRDNAVKKGAEQGRFAGGIGAGMSAGTESLAVTDTTSRTDAELQAEEKQLLKRVQMIAGELNARASRDKGGA